jgi:clan AA aspartic protease
MNKGNKMGNISEEITLINDRDDVRVQAGLLKEARQVTVSAIVDTGATTVVIDEALRQELGLSIVGTKWTTFANGTRQECGITEPVTVRWKNRDCSVRAVVIPGAKAPLLGAIPLEDMDLMIDPVHKRLAGVHGDVVETLALSA